MPRQAADLEEALKKKGGLTLSQLANYDDLLTDALVDRVYFWSTIRKLKAKYYPCRGVQEETVCAILRENVVWEKDVQAAHKKLLELSGIAKYYRGLKSEDEKEHFERHLRKYINIYLPDCPFEVATTNRYTIMTAEACVKARRTIKRGEMIRYLSGIQVEMTEREEEELSSRTDFSIVLSSRRKRPSLFLGPARFANHDCDSNARLNTSGPHGIHIVAVKEILPGDEITVTYGEDYFGIDNCECLCATCESLQRNGWDPKGPWLKDDSSDDESEDGDEEEAEESAERGVSSRMQQQPTRSASAVLGKRKRGEDVAPSDRNSEEPAPAKKRRGRPRKNAQPDSGARSNLQGAQTTSRAGPSEEHDEVRQNLVDRVSEMAYGALRANPEAERNQQPRKGKGQFTGGENETADSYDRSQGSPRDASPDGTLDKIYELLWNIAEREINYASEKKKLAVVQAKADTTPEDAEAGDDTLNTLSASIDDVVERSAPLSRRDATAEGTGLLTPPYARALSRSPEWRSEKKRRPPPPTPSSLAGSSKLRVPTIKKERSVSSLRNVVNATTSDDTPDVFSIPASPAPEPPPKRKRGRPRKYPRPEELEDSTDSSTSSASHHGDSLSSASTHASSATSLDTFAAGNIADSICQMLITNAETADAQADAEAGAVIEVKKEDEEPIEIAPPIPRKTRRQAQAEAALAEEAARAEKEAAKQERGRRRRQPLRTSPRKAPQPSSRSRPPIPSIETPDPTATSSGKEGHHRGPIRTLGDYHLTSVLLATPYHRWISCRNCDEFFVQGEAYLTRIACPRCERHSKLYGYYWPKTDREGKGDVEERVRDHRTIHRFIEPEEERGERKGRRTLVDVVREESERVGVWGSEEVEVEGKRLRSSPGGRRRGRVTM